MSGLKDEEGKREWRDPLYDILHAQSVHVSRRYSHNERAPQSSPWISSGQGVVSVMLDVLLHDLIDFQTPERQVSISQRVGWGTRSAELRSKGK